MKAKWTKKHEKKSNNHALLSFLFRTFADSILRYCECYRTKN